MAYQLYQAVATFQSRSFTRVDADLLSPATPVDITIEAAENLSSVATLATQNGLLKVIDKNTGLWKDSLYGFTRTSTNSTELVGCMRLRGYEINIGDIIRSAWGPEDVALLQSYLNNGIGMRPWITKNAIATLTSTEVYSNAVLCDTSGAGFAVTLPIVGATDDGLVAWIKCEGVAGNATITAGAGSTIDGAATFVLMDTETAQLIYNHGLTDWEIV